MAGFPVSVVELSSFLRGKETGHSGTADGDDLAMLQSAEQLLNIVLSEHGFRAEIRSDGVVLLTSPDGRMIFLSLEEVASVFLPAIQAEAGDGQAVDLAAFMTAFETLAQSQAAPKLWLADGYAPGQRGNGEEWNIIEDAPKQPIDIRDRDTVLSADPAKMSSGHFNTNYDPGFIGPAIGHLPGLGDEDYVPRPFDPPTMPGGHCSDDKEPVAVLVQNQTMRFDEDISGGFSGSIFANGLPVGAVITDLQVTSVQAGGRVLLGPDGSFSFVPPPDYSGNVSFSYSFVDGTGARRSATITSVVSPVSDPALSDPITVGMEDTPVPFGAALADPVNGIRERDRDGSEVITAVRINAPPAGFTLTQPQDTPGAIITVGPDGAISIHSNLPGDTGEAAIRAALATITLMPPRDFSGSAKLDIAITTKDGEAAPRVTSLPHTITIRPVTDAVTIPVQGSSGLEDGPINFGRNITWTETEVPDVQSETVTRIILNALPAGYTLTPGSAPGAIVTVDAFGRTIIISTLAGQAGEDSIRAALDAFSISSPLNSDADITLGFSVSVVDQTGAITTTSGTHNIVFAARADAPIISGSASGEEDTLNNVPINVALSDTDGSETITAVTITGIPAGANFAWGGVTGGTVTGTGTPGDPIIITGTPAEIAARLTAFQLQPPPDFHGSIPLTVRATSTETNPTGGQLDQLSTTTNSIINVVVNAEADVPAIVAGTTTGLQDQWVRFGSDPEIVFEVTDSNTINGGETISRVTLLPADPAFSIRFNPALTLPVGVSMNFDAGTGIYSITSFLADPVAAETAIRAFLAGLETRGGAFLADDTTIAITVMALDRDGSTRTSTATHMIIVDPVGDPPIINLTSSTGDEDTPITVGSNITYAVVDHSETITSIDVTGIPVGATTSVTPAVGIVITAIPGGFRIESDGVTVLTHAQIESAIRVTLDSFTLQPPPDSDTDIQISIVATSRDTDGSVGTSLPTTHTIVVNPVSDIAIGPASIAGIEDASLAIGSILANSATGLRQTDGNTPERVTEVTVGGFPSGASVLITAAGGGTVSFDGGTGIYTITGPNETAIRATLATLTVQTGLNLDEDFNIAITVTTQDGSAAPLTRPMSIPVNVAARADVPTIGGGVTILEDAGAINPNITVTRADADGTETITFVVIDQVTGGGLVTFSGLDTSKVSLVTTGSGPTAIHTLTLLVGATQADMDAALATIRVIAPADSDTDITLRVATTSTETNPTGGQVNILNATTTSMVSITVNPVSDAVVVSGSTLGNEDTTFTFGTGIVWTESEVAADRSEVVTGVSVALPPGAAAAGWVITPPGIPVNVTISGSNAAGFVITSSLAGQAGEDAIRAALDAFQITPPLHADNEITLAITVTAQDGSAASVVTNGSHAITVAARADVPTGSGSASGDEDSFIDIPISIGLTDTDGSETITSVSITGIPAGATIGWNGNSSGSVAGLGTIGSPLVITGTQAEIAARVAALEVRPPQDSDTDFALSVTVNNAETNPTGGQVNLLSNSLTFAVPVTVNPVSDAVVVSGSTLGNEDTTFTFGTGIVWTESEVAADRSEVVTGVSVALPPGAAAAGWVITPPGIPVNVTISGSNAAGFVITSSLAGQAGEDAIRAALDAFQITPPLHADNEITLAITVTAQDGSAASVVTNGSHAITVAARADVPTGSGSASGDEDSFIDIPISIGLTDTDGSETITSVSITGIPAGATIGWNGNSSGSVAGLGTIGSPLVITGTQAEIAARVAALEVRPPQDSDTDFALSVTVNNAETNPTGGQVNLLSNSLTFAVPVTVNPVSDAVVVSGSTLGNEDTTFTFGTGIVWTESEVAADRSEVVTGVSVALPPGAAAAGWVITPPGIPVNVTISGSNAAGFVITSSLAGQAGEDAIRAALDAFQITPPLHADNEITLAITVTAQDGSAASVVTNGSHAITVAARADVPTGSGSASGDEDSFIDIPISIGLTDTDGSETITSVSITGIPAGATIGWNGNSSGSVAGLGTIGSPLVITGTQAEIAARVAALEVRPPQDSDTDFALSVTVNNAETNPTGGQVNLLSNSLTFAVPVTVNPVSDAVVVSGSTLGNEDTTFTFGTGIVWTESEVAADRSEVVTGVSVALPPGAAAAGWVITPPGIPVNVTISGSNAAGFVITSSLAGQAGEDAIRAALDAFQITPPLHADNEITLAITVTAQDGSAASVVTNGSHAITVAARADVPTGSGSASGDEDSFIDIPISIGLTDTDGSETITSVSITGIPAGATIGWNGNSSGSVAGLGTIGSPLVITGTQAEIAARVAALEVRPPQDSDTDFALSVTVNNAETNPTGGQVNLLSNSLTFAVPVTVNPVSDAVVVSGSTLGNEDTTFTFGTGIVWTESEVAADRSEVVTGVSVALPPGAAAAGWVITPPGIPVNVTISGSNAAGFVITSSLAGQAGEDAIRAALDAFQITPPLHADNEITLAITVTAQDGSAASVVTNGSHAITVAARADVPTGSGSASGDEDSFIDIPISIGLTDTDGSETITSVSITGIPAGATIGWNGNSSGSVAGLGTIGSPLVITGTQAEIAARVAALEVRPPQDSDTDFALSVTVNNAETNPTGGQVNLLSNSLTFAVPVTVNPVSDAVVVSGSTLGNEDTTFTFGTGIVWTESEVAADRSEVVTGVSVALPPGAAAAGWVITPPGIPVNVTISGSNAAGFVITSSLAGQAGEDAIRAALDAFQITPPLHADNEITLAITVTAQDGSAASVVTNGSHAITVAARADVPTGSGSASGDEDSFIDIPISIGLTDTDGSETITSVSITGIPAGATIGWNGNSSGSVAGLGTIGSPLVITGTQAEIAARVAALEVRPPQDSDTDFALSVTVNNAETNPTGGQVNLLSNSLTFAVPVTVNPVSDAVVVSGSTLGNEDTTFTFGTGIVWTESEVAADRSEVVTGVSVALPPGAAAAGWVITPPGIPVNVTISGSNAAGFVITSSLAGQAGEDAIRAALDAFQITPPLHADNEITLAITVTAQDGSAASVVTNGSHAITVAARADVPTGSGSASGDEDSFIDIPISIGLTDTDGSETITSVSITGIPAGATIGWNGNSSGSVAGLGTIGSPLVITGTQAEIAARVAALEVRPPQDSDTDFALSVTVNNAETNPTGGQVNLLSNSLTFAVPVTVNPVSDAVVVSGSTLGNEDTTFTFGTGIVWTESEVAADRSEVISRIVIGAAPAGWTITGPVAPADVTITGASATGFTIISTLTGQAGENAIRAALNAFTATPPAQSSANATIAVTVFAKDGSAPETASPVYSHPLNVRAVADAPDAAAPDAVTQPFTGVEDTRIQISGTGAANGGISVTPSADNSDTSEVFTYTITGVPAGYSFHTASTGGSTVGTFAAGIWTFTKAQIDAGLFLQPPAQTSVTLNLTINARSSETGPGAGAEIAVLSATDAAPFTVVFGAVTDPVVIGASSSIVSENNGSTTDAQQTLINLGLDLNLSVADASDGSQDIEIILSGIPAGFTVPQTAPGTIVMIVDNIAGTITLRDTGSSSAADVLLFLDTLQIRLPASMNDRDQNFTVGVATSTRELSTGVTVTQNGTHQVVVRAVADSPTTDADAGTAGVQTTRTINAVEDGGGIAVALGASLNDADGSETLSVVVSGLLPTQGSLNYVTGGGVTVARDGVTGAYTLTGNAAAINTMLGTTVLTKPTDNSTDVTLTITSTATESNPSEPDAPAGSEIAVPTVTSSVTVTIQIAPRAEAPSLAAGSITTQPEWGSAADDIPLAGVFTVTQADGDDDETEQLFVEVTGLPTGTTLRDNLGAVIASTGSGPDGPIWRLPINSLATSFIRLPEDFSGSVDLKVTGIARDTDPEGGAHEQATAQQTVSFTVTPLADTPTVGASNSRIDEDSAASEADNLIGSEITYSKNDADGSEVISAVEVTGFTGTVGNTLAFTIMGVALGGVIAGVGGATITPVGDGFRITGPEADIRATLNTLRTEPQANSDINVPLSIRVTSTDGGSSVDATGTHTVVVRAEADMPSVVVGSPVVVVAEDGANTALVINPNASADIDGTELMTVRVTIPFDGPTPIGTIATGTFGNVTVTQTATGVYLITSSSTTPAGREADLDGYLNGGIAFNPRDNWSGELTGSNAIRVDVISSEAASGAEVDPEATGAAGGQEAVATNYIDIRVTPVADAPAVNIVNAVGDEDRPSRLSIEVNLNDTDGSENYTIDISGVPALGSLVDAAGAPIAGVINAGGGVWTISAASANAMATILSQLHFLPPTDTGGETATGAQDYSFAVAVTVIDANAAGSDSITSIGTISVSIVGDADTVNVAPVAVNATEDQRIAIGAAIRATLGTDAAILTDNDGSETLSFVITLPPGVQPVDGSGNPIGSFVGSGWSISSAQLANLHIPAPTNFSGNYSDFFSGFRVAVVNQEADGDQRVTTLPVTISIAPVSNGPGDGIQSWTPAVQLTEGSAVSFANIVSSIQLADGMTIVSNGPETVESVTVDFANLLASPTLIPGITTFTQLFTASYIDGIGAPGLIIDTAVGTITGTPSQIAAMSIRAAALTDSNVDFTLGVSAVTRDPGGVTTSSASAVFTVDIVGDADTPTSTAPSSLSGTAGTPIALPIGNVAGSFGGSTTDTDAAQGRPNSETIYYIVSGMPTSGGKLGFVDSGGNLIGSNLGDGNWYLTPADLATPGGIFLASTPSGSSSTATLTWRTVAVENDGDLASADAPTTITVSLAASAGGPGTPPNAPVVTISPPVANEDGLIDLGVTATGGAGDTIVVVLTALPPGVTVTGAIRDGYGNYILPVTGGMIDPSVQIRAAENFAGQLTFPLRVVATNASLLEAAVANNAVVTVASDASGPNDGPAFSIASPSGTEGTPVALGLSISPRDNDAASSEIVDFAVQGVTVTVPAGSTLSGGTPLGGGVYQFSSAAALAAAVLTPPEDYHGAIVIQVAARTLDIDPDGAGPLSAPYSPVVIRSLTITIAADADAPLVSVGGPYVGTEDQPIALPGITAALDDSDPTNGAEVLSVVIEGVPEGARLTGASNNGDGTWTVNGATPAAIAAALATMTITPPPNYGGTMHLTVAAFAIEQSNGDLAVTRVPLNVTVAPRADNFVIDALNTTANGATLLNIDLRGNDLSGTGHGEQGPESVRLDFTNLPPGSTLSGPEGTFSDLGGGAWRYIGSPAGAELITIEPGTTGIYTVGISGVSIDGGHTLASPVVDTFILNATVNTTAVNLTGTALDERLSGSTANDAISGAGGADSISGGAGIDLLSGGDGNDILSGGAGNDTLNGNNDGDRLHGGAGADTLDGGAGSDLVSGGAGIDLLTGGSGADIFQYSTGDVAALAGTGDTITDFSVGSGDRIDLSALLPGYDGNPADLSQYVSLVESGTDTTIRIASSIPGVIDTSVVVLQGVTGLDLAQMKQNGVLIA